MTVLFAWYQIHKKYTRLRDTKNGIPMTDEKSVLVFRNPGTVHGTRYGLYFGKARIAHASVAGFGKRFTQPAIGIRGCQAGCFR